MPDCSSSAAPGECAAVAAVARTLAAGGVAVYPTETLYALGVDALQPRALSRLVALKGRAPGQAIAVLIADAAMLDDLVTEVSPLAAALMRRFWPGPLTLVLPPRPALSPLLTGAGGIGVRLSSHPLATALVRAVGRPLTAPSANPAGLPPPADLAAARAYFVNRVDAYLDGGQLPGEPASTVVDVRGGLLVIREGAIAAAALRASIAETEEAW